MSLIVDLPRFINSGAIVGGLVMGNGASYLDNRKGQISGGVSLNGGDDIFLGGHFSERVDGGVGNDWIDGGGGRDVLAGGQGRDSFVFAVAPRTSNADLIVDFNPADDTFAITRVAFAGIAERGALPQAAFHAGARAADAADRVIYNKAAGTLFYDPDGTGAQPQTLLAVLLNKAKLGAGDFMVI